MLALACAPNVAGANSVTGGTSAVPVPSISGWRCLSGCLDASTAAPGSVVRVSGRYLDAATRIVFLGGRGTGDDVGAPPRAARVNRRKLLDPNRWADVTVPRTARSGPLAAVNEENEISAPSRSPIGIVTGLRKGRSLVSGNGVDAQLDSRKVYFGSQRGARITYVVKGPSPRDVRVELQRVSDGQLVAAWQPGVVAPGSLQTIEWTGGGAQADGRYQFQIYTGPAATQRAAEANGSVAQSAQAASPSVGDSFVYLKYMFPVRGKHDYGGPDLRFGYNRGDHVHTGQDMLAACGTPLVAVRSGRIEGAGSSSGGYGNFVSIDAAGTKYDFFYAHLQGRPLVREGQRVYTGQRIGYVGRSGNATACHLHFELWDGPWYGGGRAVDPLSSLKAWDRAG
jgi:murein DD-endopeptidase MepM/ murein hydrolase activator NlpD